MLTLATGTGKTFIAFQLAWKLFHSRWSLKNWKDEGQQAPRRPRILFLADRNILADQAYNAFSAFSEDALARISPDEIRKKGRVPKNASIFFTIFQTFMSGRDTDGHPAPSFGDYSPDFFDFIVIDECHRGGTNDESSCRDILEYFSPAVQLGLTATPKRKGNIDPYAYFGELLYIYFLKEDINDGYLTPFKVKQIATDYVYTADDTLMEGEIEEGKRYKEADFNRVIEIREREAYRVKFFMTLMDQNQKTLVFCPTQVHALVVRDLVNQAKLNRQNKSGNDPNYCVRVTANDGKPISAIQFIEGLYGELPELFKNENELRTLWSRPDTRKALLTGLEEKGYGNKQLAEVRLMIDAEKSDLFDVLAYIAFALPTLTRKERVERHRELIFRAYSDKQLEFLAFVLDHYITQGVRELDQEKLPDLLELKYHSVGDAVAKLGDVSEIRNVFISFQEHLYLQKQAA